MSEISLDAAFERLASRGESPATDTATGTSLQPTLVLPGAAAAAPAAPEEVPAPKPQAVPAAPSEEAPVAESPGLELGRAVRVPSFLCGPAAPGTAVADAYSQLRLRLRAAELPLPSVLLTSCYRREGTTKSAVQLALTCARQRAQRILLLELNLRTPSLENGLGITPERTVCDVLEGACHPEEALVFGEEDNLYAMVAPLRPQGADELLQPDRLLPLLALLHRSFDRVVIDCAPCLTTADPLLIGAHCGGVVLVVRAHDTLREDVHHALKTLGKQGTTVAGLVLSGVRNPALLSGARA